MKFAILFELYLFCVILNVGGSEGETDTFKCDAEVIYQENDCNVCWCNKLGLGCTRKLCASHQDPKLSNCTVGSTWKRGCDQCWCVKKMGIVCTLDCGEKPLRSTQHS
ncbi:hypothetical protein ILUMI_05607 [Ignelater luminosus]|uniref:Uncharacterized protein n=1 Tax=Ignelater luminosus TaxID=2038154 RepID=A0A8K0DHB7_IGNLU|nr:hypothetical protein ILUMI_05607 [Ignelater luminosus]